jgi:hypothetical protein
MTAHERLQGTLLIDELGKPFLQLIQAGDEVPMPKISIVSILNKLKIIIFAYICKHQKKIFLLRVDLFFVSSKTGWSKKMQHKNRAVFFIST